MTRPSPLSYQGAECVRCGTTERRVNGRCVHCILNHPQLLLRRAALEAGRSFYRGVPCKEGHTRRDARNGRCIRCVSITNAGIYAAIKADPVRHAEWKHSL